MFFLFASFVSICIISQVSMPYEHGIKHIHYSLKREINELYWSMAIGNFAVGLIGLYIPIYMFQYFNGSIAAVFIFYILQTLFQVLLVPFSARLFNKIGVKKILAIGKPFLALYLVALTFLDYGGWWFLAIAIFFKIIFLITTPLGHHVDFARFSSGKKRGSQLGTGQIIIALSKAAAPFIGGLIIVHMGYTPVFIVAVLLTVVSIIPLFFSDDAHESYTLDWKRSFKYAFAKDHRRTSLGFFVEGVEYSAAIFLLPIFIFTIIGNLETLGWITSVSLVISILFTHLIGVLVDKHGPSKVLHISSWVHFITWVSYTFIQTPVQYFYASSSHSLAATSNHLPMSAKYYTLAHERKHGVDEFVVFHEIMHNLGRTLMFTLIIVGFALGITNFLIYFSVAALAAFAYRFMK